MTCRYCNQDGLHWVETRVGWRLFNSRNIQHNCLKKKLFATPKSRIETKLINFRPDPKIEKALRIFKKKLKLRY